RLSKSVSCRFDRSATDSSSETLEDHRHAAARLEGEHQLGLEVRNGGELEAKRLGQAAGRSTRRKNHAAGGHSPGRRVARDLRFSGTPGREVALARVARDASGRPSEWESARGPVGFLSSLLDGEDRADSWARRPPSRSPFFTDAFAVPSGCSRSRSV